MSSEPKKKPLAESDIDFQGNLLINTRTITSTNDFFGAITGPGRREDRISVTQLAELLVLLETIATAHELVYDATVPEREIARLRAAEDELERNIGNRDLFRGVRPASSDETLSLCKAGIRQSAMLLRERIDVFAAAPGAVRERLPDISPMAIGNPSPRAFADALSAPTPPSHERDEYLADLIERNPFNGAKCVAGILAMDPDDEDGAPDGGDFRGLCRALVTGKSDEELRWIVPMLINGFRSNFLNTLAADHGDAAFFAGPAIEQVMDQQVLLLGSYVAGKLSRRPLERDLLESALAKKFQTTDQFPFLGLLTLLSARNGDPYSVFECSLGDKDMLRNRFLAQKGTRKRFIHDFASDELADFKEEKLGGVFKRLERRVAFHAAIDRLNRTFVQPVIEGYRTAQPFINAALGITGMLPDNVAVPLLDDIDIDLPELPEGVGPASAYLIDRVILPDGYMHYKTFTHQIRQRLNVILANRGVQDVITERVQDVLGCEIVEG